MRALSHTLLPCDKRGDLYFLIIAFVLSAFLLLVSGEFVLAEREEAGTLDRELNLVWSANYDQGEQIFFSSYKKNNWTIPVQISDSEGFVFQPVSSAGADGSIWVVWTAMQKEKRLLQFSVYEAGQWIKPRRIETGMDDNRGATLIVDDNGTPWIAWTAVKEGYSDVFWSRWNGTRWESPVKVHPDNNVPDTHPALAIDESGQVLLSWRTFADGKYKTVAKKWNGEQWQKLSYASGQNGRMKKIRDFKGLSAIPEGVKERHKATIFWKDSAGAGSLPLSQF